MYWEYFKYVIYIRNYYWQRQDIIFVFNSYAQMAASQNIPISNHLDFIYILVFYSIMT